MLLNFLKIFFLARKVCLLLYFFSCGFWFDRILISEALFSTFPVKRFMQQLIHSLILSRFHLKDRSLLFSKKLQ